MAFGQECVAGIESKKRRERPILRVEMEDLAFGRGYEKYLAVEPLPLDRIKGDFIR
jgi:hypothetical protein